MAIQEYKCPCCDGAIEFDSALQKMKCPYCETEFEVSTLKNYDDVLKTASAGDKGVDVPKPDEWQPGEAEGMRVYACNTCGGEIIGDANTAATSCPYCGNPVVFMSQFTGDLRPDCVIPFKLDKAAAKAALNRHLSGKRLLPKIFQDQNHIDEIKGIYVPFWIFDADANANISYKATRTRCWSDSRYNYTETSYFSILRGGQLSFSGVPVDGSTQMPDDLMQSIEPYDMSAAVDFQTAYLAGYLADKYDVNAEASVETANARIRKSTEDTFASTVSGYLTVLPQGGNVQISDSKARYALFPVWLLNTTWNGQRYTFAMNGQTGKFVGDLPVDKAAKNKWFWGLTAGVTAAVLALSYLLYLL